MSYGLESKFQNVIDSNFDLVAEYNSIESNIPLEYSFEVDINDFANSWYLNIEDAKCEYTIELGRRPNPFYYNKLEGIFKQICL